MLQSPRLQTSRTNTTFQSCILYIFIQNLVFPCRQNMFITLISLINHSMFFFFSLNPLLPSFTLTLSNCCLPQVKSISGAKAENRSSQFCQLFKLSLKYNTVSSSVLVTKLLTICLELVHAKDTKLNAILLF